MRALFSDLLPPQVIARTAKAEFSAPLFGEQTRRFARRWDGGGLDPRLIDSDVLAHFRSLGPGWQTRINAALRQAARLPKQTKRA